MGDTITLKSAADGYELSAYHEAPFTPRKGGVIVLQEIFGVDKLADSAVVIKGRIRTTPIRQWDVGREYLKRIKLAFDKAGVEIPFPHRTLYFGEVSKPVAVELSQHAHLKAMAGEATTPPPPAVE